MARAVGLKILTEQDLINLATGKVQGIFIRLSGKKVEVAIPEINKVVQKVEYLEATLNSTDWLKG